MNCDAKQWGLVNLAGKRRHGHGTKSIEGVRLNNQGRARLAVISGYSNGYQITALHIQHYSPLTSRIQFITSDSSAELATRCDCLRASATNFFRLARLT